VIKNIIDNRTFKNTSKCDALVFKRSNNGKYLFDEDDIVACYESIDIDELLETAVSSKIEVIVIIYDLNSKPLK
jgi:hypothetical protein